MQFFKIFILLLFIVSCTISQPTNQQNDNTALYLVSEYNLQISEPSGLTYDGQFLWTVSDNTGSIYKLDTLGTVIKELNINAQDPEGIAYDYNTNTLWIVEEATSNIKNISLTGDIISWHHLDFVEQGNSGLEGICIKQNNNFCLLKEKNPGYFYLLSSDFNLIKSTKLDFANDYSGIFPHTNNCYWIVSDQSKKLFLWDNISDTVIKKFSLPFSKAEGIVFINKKSIIYIISDLEHKLYKYKLVENF